MGGGECDLDRIDDCGESGEKRPLGRKRICTMVESTAYT
jgi:hypothetical protein